MKLWIKTLLIMLIVLIAAAGIGGVKNVRPEGIRRSPGPSAHRQIFRANSSAARTGKVPGR